MPVRTTQDLVSGIIDVDDGVDLTPFILSANELVTEFCAPVTTYSVERLELIERWLSAHMYTVLSPRAIGETAGSIQAQYQSKVALGLKNSHYGQMALRLDTNGGLAAFDNGVDKAAIPVPAEKNSIKVGVTWVGSVTDTSTGT